MRKNNPEINVRNKEIVKLRYEGVPLSNIADRFGLSYNQTAYISRSNGYVRPEKQKKVGSSSWMNVESEAQEEIRYLNVLHDFSCTVERINKSAADGRSVECVKNNMKKISDAYRLLAGIDDERLGSLKIKSNIQCIDGWLRCPVCHSKIAKVAAGTVLLSFPAYCKRCKREYVVNWQQS